MVRMREFCFFDARRHVTLATGFFAGGTVDKIASRVVAVNLTDAEWRALRVVTPDPCGWIKTQIRSLLDESGFPIDQADEKDRHTATAFAD